MASKVLVDREVEAGRLLLEQLDRQQISVKAAFWNYDVENERWRLVLAMPICDTQGPIAAYGKIQDALKQIPEAKRLDLNETNAANTRDILVEALCKLVRTGPGISSIRVTDSSANGVYIDDALIYRTT